MTNTISRWVDYGRKRLKSNQIINTVEELIESANCKLFKNSENQQHCLHPLLLQLNQKIIISGLNDISTRSQTTPQNYINVPPSHVAYSSIINLSFRLLYIVYLFFYCFTCFTILTAFIDHVRLLHVFLIKVES